MPGVTEIEGVMANIQNILPQWPELVIRRQTRAVEQKA